MRPLLRAKIRHEEVGAGTLWGIWGAQEGNWGEGASKVLIWGSLCLCGQRGTPVAVAKGRRPPAPGRCCVLHLLPEGWVLSSLLKDWNGA